MKTDFDWGEIVYGLKKTYRYAVAILFLKHIIFLKNLKKQKGIKWAPDKYILLGFLILLLITSLIDSLSSILLMTIILIQYNFYTYI